MSQVFGYFDETLLEIKQEHLTLVFSPVSFSVKERWPNNSLSADFLADYFANFFPGADNASAEISTRAQIRSAISYIANELLENAVKFHCDPTANISMTLLLDRDKLTFLATNLLDRASAARFEQFIQMLSKEDPAELYLRQLEQNALDETNHASGLGILTMIQDYGAQLGWKFEPATTSPELIQVTTLVQLSLKELTSN